MARPELEEQWRSNAEQEWEHHVGEKVPEFLDQAYSLTSEHPDVFQFNHYFFELLDSEHDKRKDFIAREIDRQKYSDRVRVFDRDPVKKTGDLEELVCEYCDNVQFSLTQVEDLSVCRPCADDQRLSLSSEDVEGLFYADLHGFEAFRVKRAVRVMHIVQSLPTVTVGEIDDSRDLGCTLRFQPAIGFSNIEAVKDLLQR